MWHNPALVLAERVRPLLCRAAGWPWGCSPGGTRDAFLGGPQGCSPQHPGEPGELQGLGDGKGAGGCWLGRCCPLLVQDETLCLATASLQWGCQFCSELAGFGYK